VILSLEGSADKTFAQVGGKEETWYRGVGKDQEKFAGEEVIGKPHCKGEGKPSTGKKTGSQVLGRR
jgi:hypothetical protein